MSKQTSLLDLPGELRNAIYEAYAESMTLRIRDGLAVNPPLSQTCRTVRRELMSILHRYAFHTAPLEMRVIDWDFDPVLAFLKKLKLHSDGSTRRLKICIDVYTPAANYSPQRLQWCLEARFALAWYAENPARAVQLMQDNFAPVRLKIEEQFFDVTHIVRFPLSRFPVQDRCQNQDWQVKFVQTYARQLFRSRPATLHYYLERSLLCASQSAAFVSNYWEVYARRNEELRLIQEEAWRSRLLRQEALLEGVWNESNYY